MKIRFVFDRTLGGTLSVTGSVSGTGFSASSSGTLSAVKSGFKGSSSVSLLLDGQFRDSTVAADLITGTVNGSGSGDFDFDVTDGSFYAIEN